MFNSELFRSCFTSCIVFFMSFVCWGSFRRVCRHTSQACFHSKGVTSFSHNLPCWPFWCEVHFPELIQGKRWLNSFSRSMALKFLVSFLGSAQIGPRISHGFLLFPHCFFFWNHPFFCIHCPYLEDCFDLTRVVFDSFIASSFSAGWAPSRRKGASAE